MRWNTSAQRGCAASVWDEDHQNRQHKLSGLKYPVVDARQIDAEEGPYKQAVYDQQNDDRQAVGDQKSTAKAT